MSESRLFSTGNNLEQAVLAAARHFSLEPAQVAYEKVERKASSCLNCQTVALYLDRTVQ